MTNVVLNHQITDASAWRGENLGPDEGRVSLNDEAIAEILSLAKLLDDNPLPATVLDPDDFELPHCRAAMSEAKEILSNGLGFVLIDRLPLEEISRDAAKAVYWLVMAMIGRAVAQKWDGRMIYDVADLTGKKPGNGIRADVTNVEQNFHTDNAYNICPPEYVALLCLNPAKTGGISRVASINTAHNQMLARHPDLLRRLYQPLIFDRQREHAPVDTKVIERPALANIGGRLTARLSANLVRQGCELAGEKLDAEAEDAFSAIYETLDDPQAYREFFFKPGQIQIIDNRTMAHKRTAFEDWSEPVRKRHLVRLWLRQEGRPFYNG